MTARAVSRNVASAAEVAARVDAIRMSADAPRQLAAMLAEQSPIFAGLGTTEAERLRGYMLASFETVGLPAEAVPYVLEELETGRNPYTVAAAARALRGAVDIPAESPALLVGAIARLRDADDHVSFESFVPAPASPSGTTVLVELARTLTNLGSRGAAALEDLVALVRRASESFSPAVRAELAKAIDALARPDLGPSVGCCREHPAAAPPTTVSSAAGDDLTDLDLENQDGARLTFFDAFSGRPTALAFFYTRCMNPEKCSLTVTRLARLARLIDREALDANVAGITYDPAFDRPARLRAYGVARSMEFSPRCSLLRTLGPFDPVREAFDLGVGFGPNTVNRHRLELIVLDASLGVAQRFERRLWHEETALDAIRAAASVIE
jgi:cytochrome oxidase Cu insertion factor (SCO1/SenC/PrrC family)